MPTLTIPKTSREFKTLDSFNVKGEEFVVLKKECLNELFILMKSVFAGETLLKEGKTRSLNDFLKSISQRRK